MSVGEILDVAFGIYRKHLATLITIAVLLTGLPLVLFGAGAATLMPSMMGNILGILLLVVAFIIGYVILTQLAMGASVLVIAEGYLGRTLGASDAVRRTLSRLGLLITSGLLVGLVVGLGTLMILVPGIILLCGLIITTQVVMLESTDNATAAMGRAWSLSKGFRWRMFLLLLVGVVLSVVVVTGTNVAIGLVTGSFTAAPEPGEVPAMGTLLLQQGVQLIVNMIVSPFTYCVLTVAYYDLRVRKEAFDLEILANSLAS
jgi:hypothetical protein